VALSTRSHYCIAICFRRFSPVHLLHACGHIHDNYYIIRTCDNILICIYISYIMYKQYLYRIYCANAFPASCHRTSCYIDTKTRVSLTWWYIYAMLLLFLYTPNAGTRGTHVRVLRPPWSTGRVQGRTDAGEAHN